MNLVSQVVILSAEIAAESVVANRVRTASLEAILELKEADMPFKQAVGVYKGKQERSFVIIVKNEEQIEELKSLAFKKFGQESILVQDANQRARLVFRDNSSQELGKLVQTSKEIAEKQDAYTVLNGDYFITV